MKTNVQLTGNHFCNKRINKTGIRLLSLLVCLIMGMTMLTGCGSGKYNLSSASSTADQPTVADTGNSDKSSTTPAKVEKANKKIVIIKGLDDGIRKQLEESTLSVFEKNGYVKGKNLEVTVLSLDGDAKKAPDIIKKAVELKPDGIILAADYATYSNGAKVLTDSGIPCVAYSGIESTGFVDENGNPKSNITGIYTMQKDMYRNAVSSLLNKIAPIGDKKAVFITDPVIFTKESVEADLKAVNVPLKEYVVANNLEEYKTAVEKYNKDEEVGWILIGIWPWTSKSDPKWTIDDTAKWDIANRKKPSVSVWEDPVKRGILCALGIDIPALGEQSANMLSGILDGEKVENVKAEYPLKANIVLNMKNAKDLKLEVPPEILGAAKIYETDINSPDYKP